MTSVLKELCYKFGFDFKVTVMLFLVLNCLGSYSQHSAKQMIKIAKADSSNVQKNICWLRSEVYLGKNYIRISGLFLFLYVGKEFLPISYTGGIFQSK